MTSKTVWSNLGIRHWVVRFLIGVAALLSGLSSTDRAEAACLLSNQISNGQVADAAPLMSNFNAVKACIDAVVSSIPPTFGPFATGTDASQLTGTLSVDRFGNGLNADTSHFLRGDGQWALPPNTGTGGPATPTPTVRASSILPFNASSVTVSWPSGTIAGDLVVIFVGDGYAVNSPSGWAVFNNTGSNDWANGLTAAKIMTAADISAGAVNVTLTGAYNGVATAITIDGNTVNGVRDFTAARSSGNQSYSISSPAGLFRASGSDLILGFTYIRGSMTTSISNFTQIQSANTANASVFLGRYSATLSKIGLTESATYPSGNNGYYWSLLAIY